MEILCIQNSVRSKVHENSNTTSERISPNCAVVALYGCSSRSLLSFSRFLHKTEDQYTIWGIEKSFIKQKTRYKRAESILTMLVCIALEIDYGVSFVLNTPWSEIKSEVAILVFFKFPNQIEYQKVQRKV